MSAVMVELGNASPQWPRHLHSCEDHHLSTHTRSHGPDRRVPQRPRYCARLRALGGDAHALGKVKIIQEVLFGRRVEEIVGISGDENFDLVIL